MDFIEHHFRACLAIGLILFVSGTIGYQFSKLIGITAMFAGACLLGLCRVKIFTDANEAWWKRKR